MRQMNPSAARGLPNSERLPTRDLLGTDLHTRAFRRFTYTGISIYLHFHLSFIYLHGNLEFTYRHTFTYLHALAAIYIFLKFFTYIPGSTYLHALRLNVQSERHIVAATKPLPSLGGGAPRI